MNSTKCVCIVLLFAIHFVHSQRSPLENEATEFLQVVDENFISSDVKDQTKTINEFVDIIIDEIKKYIKENKLDPYAIPDIFEDFSYKTLFIKHHMKVNLTDGQIWNILSIHRCGDASLHKNTSLSSTLKVPICLEHIKANYNYDVDTMGIHRMGELDGKVDLFKMDIWIDIDYFKLMFKLDDLKITDRGKLKIKFRGHLWTDWIINSLTSWATRVLKNRIDTITEKIVRQGLDDIITQINHIIRSSTPSVVNTLT